MATEARWIYRTLKSHKEIAIETTSSLPLLLYAPDYVYPESNRPITDMSLYRTRNSITARRSEIIDNTVVLNNEVWNVIPVTRYSGGMSKGLYYGNYDERYYCGTFYYYEPASTTLLAYKTSFQEFNKFTALSKLTPNKKYPTKRKLYNNIIFDKFMNGDIPSDLILTPEQYYEATDSTVPFSTIDIEPLYAGKILGLYALEDDLDQPLCIAAKPNYDIVILESMVGSHQVVTEILDTRSRSVSFNHLIYIID